MAKARELTRVTEQRQTRNAPAGCLPRGRDVSQAASCVPPVHFPQCHGLADRSTATSYRTARGLRLSAVAGEARAASRHRRRRGGGARGVLRDAALSGAHAAVAGGAPTREAPRKRTRRRMMRRRGAAWRRVAVCAALLISITGVAQAQGTECEAGEPEVRALEFPGNTVFRASDLALHIVTSSSEFLRPHLLIVAAKHGLAHAAWRGVGAACGPVCCSA